MIMKCGISVHDRSLSHVTRASSESNAGATTGHFSIFFCRLPHNRATGRQTDSLSIDSLLLALLGFRMKFFRLIKDLLQQL